MIWLSIKRRKYFAGKAGSRWFGGRALDAVEAVVKIPEASRPNQSVGHKNTALRSGDFIRIIKDN